MSKAAESSPPSTGGEPTGDGPPVLYAGLVTRGVAFVIDVIAVNAIASVVVAVVNLVASAFGHHGGFGITEAAIGGAVWVIWVVSYFVGFWALAGQTPGNRVLGVWVVRATGELMTARRALLRFAGTVIALLPLGAGFLPVLFDDRRRGLNDMIADTVVTWGARQSPADGQPESVPVAD